MNKIAASDRLESGESLTGETLPPSAACGDSWIVAIISRQVTPSAVDQPVEPDEAEPAERSGSQERRLLPVKEAAYLLGIGKTKAYDLIATGELPAVRIGSKMLIRRADLDDYVAKLPRSRLTRFVRGGR